MHAQVISIKSRSWILAPRCSAVNSINKVAGPTLNELIGTDSKLTNFSWLLVQL